MLGLPVSHDLTNLVYDTLFWSQVKADPEPWLATSAEPNEDRTQWTVKLRPGVAWHDGVPFTAEDVKFTFEKMKSTTGGRYSHHVWEYPVFKSADVLDPLIEQVVIHRGEITLHISRENLVAAAQLLRDDPGLRFEFLSGVSGVHYPGDTGRELRAEQERLRAVLADASEERPDGEGRVLAILGARGGAGASVLAVAVGQAVLAAGGDGQQHVGVDRLGGGKR